MDVTGQNKKDRKDKAVKSEASPTPHSTAPRPDEALAETEINLVSPFAHPRGDRVTKFDLRPFVTRHPIPVALSCLALGGTIAAVIWKRRRRDTWDARIDRLRQALVDAAIGAG
jgi:hypothetical protein